jgi:hypothetical protein
MLGSGNPSLEDRLRHAQAEKPEWPDELATGKQLCL